MNQPSTERPGEHDTGGRVLAFPSEAKRHRIAVLRENQIDLAVTKADLEREHAEVFAHYREVVIQLANITTELIELTGKAS